MSRQRRLAAVLESLEGIETRGGDEGEMAGVLAAAAGTMAGTCNGGSTYKFNT